MREAIKEDEGGNQRRAPTVWKGPSALSEPISGNQWYSVAISGTQWHSPSPVPRRVSPPTGW
jgi:hypothetical protein